VGQAPEGDGATMKRKRVADDDGESAVEKVAIQAIDDVFSDMSVPADETISRLKNLRDVINMKLNSLGAR